MRDRTVRLAVALAALALAATGLAHAAREDARHRCSESVPAFPRRVVGIDVDWRVVPPGYDCVYLDANPQVVRLTMPPCPRGHYRATGAERCSPKDARAETRDVLLADDKAAVFVHDRGRLVAIGSDRPVRDSHPWLVEAARRAVLGSFAAKPESVRYLLN